MEPSEAKYLNSIVVKKQVHLYQVKCLKCEMEFVVHREHNHKLCAVVCNYCECAFNVNWPSENKN